MLKFLPRIVRPDSDLYNWAQQVDLGYGSTISNCNICVFKDTWTETFGQHQCELKHSCYAYSQPFIAMYQEHHAEIISQHQPGDPSVPLYNETTILRQYKVKGWPLYTQLITCTDPDAQCNALCVHHAARMADHKAVSVCAHQRGCSRSGSFFGLLVPVITYIREMFYYELNSQQP